MIEKKTVVIEGNESAASVAFRASEVIAIYPITPASAMGELSDEWAVHGRTNVWGSVPRVVECNRKPVPQARCTARCKQAR